MDPFDGKAYLRPSTLLLEEWDIVTPVQSGPPLVHSHLYTE